MLKANLEKILGCLAHDIYSITCSNEYNKMDKIVDDYLSQILALLESVVPDKKHLRIVKVIELH
jgi:hypothetical protein